MMFTNNATLPISTTTTPTHKTTTSRTTATKAGTTTQTKHSQDYLNTSTNNSRYRKQTNTESFSSSSPQLYIHKPYHLATSNNALDDQTPPPIPPLPLNYQRSDGLLTTFHTLYILHFLPTLFLFHCTLFQCLNQFK